MKFSPISFDVEVIFGAPGRQCEGAGICQIIPIGPVRVHWKCPNARAKLVLSGDGLIRLVFPKNQLGDKILSSFFMGNVFVVEERYAFPKTILGALNLTSFEVNPGHYRVKVSDSSLEISFLSK